MGVFPAVTASGAGTVGATGTGALTLPFPSATGAGEIGSTGTSALTLPFPSASGAVHVANTPMPAGRKARDLAWYWPKVKTAVINEAAAAGTTTVVTGRSRKIRVLLYSFTVGGAETVTWKSGTTAITGPMDFPAKGDGVSPVFSEIGHFETAAGEDLKLTQGTGAGVAGYLLYIEV